MLSSEQAEAFLRAFEPEVELELLRTLAAARALAVANYESLKESKKAVLAAAAAASGETSAAAQQLAAERSVAFQEWLSGWREAVFERERRILAYSNQEAKIEVWRTLMASQRAEAQLQH